MLPGVRAGSGAVLQPEVTGNKHNAATTEKKRTDILNGGISR